MSTMWEQALDAEVAYRTEQLREAARPMSQRTSRRLRGHLTGAAEDLAPAARTGRDGRRWGLTGSRTWLAAR